MTAVVEPTRPQEADEAGISNRATAVLVVLGVALIMVLQLLLVDPSAPKDQHANGAWHPPTSRSEILVARMDGHAFAQTATDPFMRHTVEDYNGDRGHAAYRAVRPFPGWVYSIASAGGQRPLLAPMILVLTALAIGWAVYSVDVLGRVLGLHVRYLGLLTVTPGILAAVAYPGIGEPMGLALSLTGLAAWFKRRTWAAVALFSAAALCAETMLFVPLGLALNVLWKSRSLRPALPLAVPAIVYAAWYQVVTVVIGASPGSTAKPTAPFAGLRMAMPYWHLAEWITAALLVASSVVILWRGYGWMKTILVPNLAFFMILDVKVWAYWWAFGRVATIIPFLALIAWARTSSAKVETDDPVLEEQLHAVGTT